MTKHQYCQPSSDNEIRLQGPTNLYRLTCTYCGVVDLIRINRLNGVWTYPYNNGPYYPTCEDKIVSDAMDS